MSSSRCKNARILSSSVPSYTSAAVLPDSANYLGTLGTYHGLHPFRVWVQKVLPQVYDDSLSYQELVYKLMYYINTLIEDVTTCEENITLLTEAYNNLQDYVNNYFDNLDLTGELEQVLDAAINDGSLFTQLMLSVVIGSGLQSEITESTRTSTETTVETIDDYPNCCCGCENCSNCKYVGFNDGDKVVSTYTTDGKTVVTTIERNGDEFTTTQVTTEVIQYYNIYSDLAEGTGISISPASSKTPGTQTISVDIDTFIDLIEGGTGISVEIIDGKLVIYIDESTIGDALNAGAGITISGNTISTNLRGVNGISVETADDNAVEIGTGNIIWGDGFYVYTDDDGNLHVELDDDYINEHYGKAVYFYYYTLDSSGNLVQTVTTMSNLSQYYDFTAPSLSGYTFVGWTLSNSSASSTVDYTEISDTHLAEGTALYAVYSKTVSLVYNANGGSGTTSTTSSTAYFAANGTVSNNTLTVGDNSFELDGYDFVNWNTKSDGSGASYEVGDSITITEDLTLYAQWEQSVTPFSLNLTSNTDGWKFTEYTWYTQSDTASENDYTSYGFASNGLAMEAYKGSTNTAASVILDASVTVDLQGCNRCKVTWYATDCDSSGFSVGGTNVSCGGESGSSVISVSGDSCEVILSVADSTVNNENSYIVYTSVSFYYE